MVIATIRTAPLLHLSTRLSNDLVQTFHLLERGKDGALVFLLVFPLETLADDIAPAFQGQRPPVLKTLPFGLQMVMGISETAHGSPPANS